MDFGLDANLFTPPLGIQSKKTTETGKSGFSYGAKGNLYYEDLVWFQMRLELGVKKVKFGQRNIKLTQDSSALSSGVIGAEFLVQNQILIGAYGGVKERLLATSLTEENLILQKKAIAQIGLGTAFVLSETGKNKVALGLNGNLLLEKSGSELGMDVAIIRSRTTLSPFVNYSSLDTNIGRQDDLGTGINFSYQL